MQQTIAADFDVRRGAMIALDILLILTIPSPHDKILQANFFQNIYYSSIAESML